VTGYDSIPSHPPRWAENLLRFVLRERDRETIPGDLLEEYQEVVLSAQGQFRANLWYLRQILSFANSVVLGVLLGAAFGAVNFVVTIFSPLAEDTAPRVIGFYGLMFAMWGAASFAVCRRSGRFMDAITTGVMVGAVTVAVFHISGVLRINVFLVVISQRADWQGLVWSFPNSGFESLRAYANYTYAKQIVPRLIAGALAGTVTGALGGLTYKLCRAVSYLLGI
jgi:hypothetical protein